jgi:dipeptidyl aminopeptidase/acylaminoacyl peptidase
MFVALLVLAAGIAAGQARKVVDPVDLVNLKHVSDARISPDGSLIAYVVNTPVPAPAHPNEHIWLVSTDGKTPARLFVVGTGADTAPRWSPDGKSLAFLSDRENPFEKDKSFHFSVIGAEDRKDMEAPEKKSEGTDTKPTPQIWLISLQGGEARPITNIYGGVKTFEWSKDGKALAFLRADQDTKEEAERKRRKEDHLEVNKDYKYDRLWIYTFSNEQARLVAKTDGNIDTFAWSPDGARFLARVSPTPRIDDYWRVSSILILNTATGATEKTLLEHAAPNFIRWSPDGRKAAFGKASPKNITGIPVIYDVDSGKETVVGASYPATIENLEWNPDSTSLLASGTEGTTPVFLKVDAASGSVTKLTGAGPNGWFGSYTLSEDGQRVAYLSETPEHPAEVFVRSGDQSQMLTSTNPQVAGWKIGTSQDLTWKSSKDGTIIHGVLLLPPGYDKSRRYKTIVHIHGGPEEAWQSGFHAEWYDWGVVLASHGYAVLLPNPRGSDGAGTAFTEANYRDWGGGDFQDIMDGVDLLVAEGVADPDHLGVGGWSFGGFMTSWVVTHTDRFKAAVVGAAVTDLFTMATTTDIAPSYLDGYYGDLASNRKLYDEHSPVRYLEHCHTPTLVVHGEADVRVPISQGEEFYNGLRFLGRDTQMLRYPREPHIFREMEHQRDSLEGMLRWYDTHLGN